MSSFNRPIVMLDFESTGISSSYDRITEVAALRIVDGQITDRFVSLVNCGVRIPAFITQLTGISQAMVNKAPPASEVVPALIEFIGDNALSAHNASFDAKFLLAESQRVHLIPRHQGLFCTLKLSRRLFPGMSNYKLATIAQSLGIRFQGTAHRAEADAEVSAHLLIHIAKHLAKTCQQAHINLSLLTHIEKLAAAKVPDFLSKQTNKPKY
ncbi:3'-5' exonuclease [Iodobacter sp. CM08]|uniref:3'-5' exonuclease n=1 Tax=Iodobacter sp. CM08 TaxID=3085902 RepID=UPI002982956F|nr:3'-5' exonuclease [Iodobacter sp. CM08]MDW5416701.1 3'-5' exonuclease [Iodobacter sp. CM08]